jgi:glycerophosphoryl diester phosphodiesterase
LQYNELKNILNKLEFICVHWTMLDKQLVQNCKLLNTKVFTYTCKNLEVYNLIKEYDIDGVVSDIVLKDDK